MKLNPLSGKILGKNTHNVHIANYTENFKEKIGILNE
jgi:hypothetical protein